VPDVRIPDWHQRSQRRSRLRVDPSGFHPARRRASLAQALCFALTLLAGIGLEASPETAARQGLAYNCTIPAGDNSIGNVDLPPPPSGETQRVLRVVADPDNLPFSNSRGEGFENRIIELVAADLNARVEYTWLPRRRGFFNQSLRQGDHHLAPGIVSGQDGALTTQPYYRAAYGFVSRSDRSLSVESLADPQLRSLRIGVQLDSDASGLTPPVRVLAQLGIVENVHGYDVQADRAGDGPAGSIMDALARGEIDVAILSAPLAGYYVKRFAGNFSLLPVPESQSSTSAAVDVCLGVRRADPLLRDELNDVLARRRTEIDGILSEFGVPVAQSH
jgi:mxaJ protein